jgi:hypothetical protein
MAQEYGMHFPQAADPDKKLHKYANSTTISLPFQVAVDLRSAKIVFADGGTATKADITKVAAKTLDGI